MQFILVSSLLDLHSFQTLSDQTDTNIVTTWAEVKVKTLSLLYSVDLHSAPTFSGRASVESLEVVITKGDVTKRCRHQPLHLRIYLK